MTPYIVDASVGIKWLLPEQELVTRPVERQPIARPVFFDLELTSMIVKK